MNERLLEILPDIKAIGWDTCHKIYLLMDDKQVELMVGYGYGDDMIYSADVSPEMLLNTIEDLYANSCGLRFIHAVTTKDNPNEGFEDIIAQFADDEETMSSTVNCYRCGNQVQDKDSFDANAFTNDGGSFCLICYTMESGEEE